MDTQSIIPPELLTVPQVADELGVSSRTVWKYVSTGELPAQRIGAKLVKVRRADLDEFVRPVVAEDPDAAFVREVVAAAGRLTPEAREAVRRLLPPVATEAVA
jgi:excisionase family DNA binding protein